MNFISLAGLIPFLSAKLQNKNRDYWTSSLTIWQQRVVILSFELLRRKRKFYSLMKKERGYIFMNYTKPSPHPNQAPLCFRQQVTGYTANLYLTCQSSWFPLKAFAGFVSLD